MTSADPLFIILFLYKFYKYFISITYLALSDLLALVCCLGLVLLQLSLGYNVGVVYVIRNLY